jgi:2,4-dienoyl-CoA reductase-like NADH-dependent reductase (Old Yellow Enzyme family)
MKKYYLQRALGGAGIIVTEATLISPQGFVHSSLIMMPNRLNIFFSSQHDRSPGIWSMEQVAGWRKITNVVHLAGSKIYCQVRSMVWEFYSMNLYVVPQLSHGEQTHGSIMDWGSISDQGVV